MCIGASLHDVVDAPLAAMFIPHLPTLLVDLGHSPRLLVLQVDHRAVQDVVLQQQRVLQQYARIYYCCSNHRSYSCVLINGETLINDGVHITVIQRQRFYRETYLDNTS